MIIYDISWFHKGATGLGPPQHGRLHALQHDLAQLPRHRQLAAAFAARSLHEEQLTWRHGRCHGGAPELRGGLGQLQMLMLN